VPFDAFHSGILCYEFCDISLGRQIGFSVSELFVIGQMIEILLVALWHTRDEIGIRLQRSFIAE